MAPFTQLRLEPPVGADVLAGEPGRVGPGQIGHHAGDVLWFAIGLELGVLTQATAAALIASGLLSVLVFPLGALSILRRAQPLPASSQPSAVGHQIQAES